jgi:hypothetical protein
MWKYGGVADTTEDKITEWRHLTEPEPTDLEALVNDYLSYKESINYKELRKKEYPPLEDFADAFYWLHNGNKELMVEYLNKIKNIKNKYPK